MQGCNRQTMNHDDVPCNRRDVAGTHDKCFCGFWVEADGTPDLAPWRMAG